jgi:hypothetical protein
VRNALLLAFVVALVVPALAWAEWTTPADLSPTGQSADTPAVGVDANGDAVFTWARSDGTNIRIQARARTAAGNLSAVQTLSAAGQNAGGAPQVAVDPNGNAVFTWVRFDGANTRIQARRRSAAGTLSAVQDLSAAGQDASDPQVAIDGSGNAVFTWVRFDGTSFRTQARARSTAGVLSPVQDLSDPGHPASGPQVAINANGDAVFTWLRQDDTNFFRAQGRARSSTGTFSAVQTLSGAGKEAAEPQVAVDTGGNAVFTWRRNDGANERIQARARTAAGTLKAVQDLSAAGQNAFGPQVGVDQDGDAVFAWSRSDGTNFRIQARERTAAGTLKPVQDLSDPGHDASNQQVAVDSAGDAVFTWQRFDGSNNRVEARSRSAAGSLRPFTVLSDPGQDGLFPQVAVDPGGDAVLTWLRFDGSFTRIQASAGP